MLLSQVGYVTRVGSEVKDFSEGDLIGVGCMIGSCKVEGRCCCGCCCYCCWIYPDQH